jgi:hypothetical protein
MFPPQLRWNGACWLQSRGDTMEERRTALAPAFAVVIAMASACGGAAATEGAVSPGGWTEEPVAGALPPVAWPLADPPRRIDGAGFAVSVPTGWDQLEPDPPAVYQARVVGEGGRLLMLTVVEGPPGMTIDAAAQLGATTLREDGWDVSAPRRMSLGALRAIEFTMARGAESPAAASLGRVAVSGNIGAMATCVSTTLDPLVADRVCRAILDTMRLGYEVTTVPPPGTRVLRGEGVSLVLPANWIELAPEDGLYRAMSPDGGASFSAIMTSEAAMGSADQFFERAFRDIGRTAQISGRTPARAGAARAIEFRMLMGNPVLHIEQRARYVELGGRVYAFTCGGSQDLARARAEICSAVLDSVRPRS